MVQFGRRLSPPSPALRPAFQPAAAAVEPEEDWTLKPARRRWRQPRRAWSGLLLGALALGLLFYGHFEPLVVQDQMAARQLTAPGFAVPPGCPARRWSGGEYMPRACTDGPGRIDRPETYGLPRTTGYRHRQVLHWVRSGPDALIVRCAPLNCRVVWSVRYLFRSPPGGIDGVYDPDARDYRAKPLDYLLTESSGMLAAAVMAAAGLVLLLRRLLGAGS